MNIHCKILDLQLMWSLTIRYLKKNSPKNDEENKVVIIIYILKLQYTKDKISWCKEQRSMTPAQPTVPSTIAEELLINPFMRVMALYNDGRNGCCLAYITTTSNLDRNHFVHHCKNLIQPLKVNVPKLLNITNTLKNNENFMSSFFPLMICLFEEPILC